MFQIPIQKLHVIVKRGEPRAHKQGFHKHGTKSHAAHVDRALENFVVVDRDSQ